MTNNIILIIQGPIFSEGWSYSSRKDNVNIDFDSWNCIKKNINGFKNIANEIVLATYSSHLNEEKIKYLKKIVLI